MTWSLPMRHRLLVLTALAAANPLLAQDSDRVERFLRNCDEYSSRRERHCEVRDTTMRLAGATLTVDGRENGGVTVHGWDRNEIRVRAMVQTHADSRAEAETLAREIRILTDADRVRADGPESRRYQGWSVSYEVWVPRKTNLHAEAQNGGIGVENVDGRIELHTVNGGISLREVNGDVRAETTNGGVTARLSGSTWTGRGLDLETTNGGVHLEIPAGYNAELETGTVNGGMDIDFPVTVRGTIGRRITTTLGRGGPRVRAITTNGGVRIRTR